MVGPRSRGCRRCVARKVKCDETRPTCTRCSKAGFKCPGYAQSFHFLEPVVAHVEPNAQPSEVDQDPPAEHKANEAGLDGPRTQAHTSTALGPPSSDLTLTASKRELQPLFESISTRSERNAELLDAFVNDLPPRLWYTKNWFAGICQSQDDQTLNTAVRALITAHGAMMFKDNSLVELSRHEYGSSLRSLRRMVAHPRPGRLSALQNSILVLAMFELYDKCLARNATQLTLQGLVEDGHAELHTEPPTWMHHARGIEQVMRRQGPLAYDRLDVNRLFYVAMRDTLVLLAYESHTACFLDEPEWQPTIFFETSPNTLDHAFCALFATQVKGPRLAYDARRAISHGSDIDEMKHRSVQLHDEAWKAFDYFMSNLALISKTPTEVPYTTSGVPHSTYSFQGVRFADVLTPRAMCSHHSLIITVNRILLKIQKHGSSHPAPTDALEAESRASAVEICKCLPALERMPVTMLGIFSLAYPAFFTERALEACPEEYREWIEVKRRRWATKER